MYTIFITNNHNSFHLWWKKNLVKNQKISKYYGQDCTITSHPKNLIDNIFCNIISHEIISGNITAYLIMYLNQFLFVLNALSINSCQKSYIFDRDWSKFIQADSLLDCLDEDWSDVLQLDQQDLSIQSFLDNMNSILDEHVT